MKKYQMEYKIGITEYSIQFEASSDDVARQIAREKLKSILSPHSVRLFLVGEQISF